MCGYRKGGGRGAEGGFNLTILGDHHSWSTPYEFPLDRTFYVFREASNKIQQHAMYKLFLAFSMEKVYAESFFKGVNLLKTLIRVRENTWKTWFFILSHMEKPRLKLDEVEWEKNNDSWHNRKLTLSYSRSLIELRNAEVLSQWIFFYFKYCVAPVMCWFDATCNGSRRARKRNFNSVLKFVKVVMKWKV